MKRWKLVDFLFEAPYGSETVQMLAPAEAKPVSEKIFFTKKLVEKNENYLQCDSA